MILPIIKFYNDLEGIKRLHSHLKKQHIRSLWADGRFLDFPMINNSSLSTDGSREYLKDQSDCFVIDLPDMTEPEKYTELLRFAGMIGAKYILGIDCDEIPIGSFEELENELSEMEDKPNIYHLNFARAKGDESHHKSHVERIFSYPERWSVKVTHWSFHLDNNEKPFISDGIVLKSLSIYHDVFIRTKEREKLMTEYQIKQLRDERSAFWARQNGISVKPTLKGLRKLFPKNEIQRNSKGYIIKGNVDANNLIYTWKRVASKDGLLVY